MAPRCARQGKTGRENGCGLSARDVYAIGRGNRPESYNLFFEKHAPLIDRDMRKALSEWARRHGVRTG